MIRVGACGLSRNRLFNRTIVELKLLTALITDLANHWKLTAFNRTIVELKLSKVLWTCERLPKIAF